MRPWCNYCGGEHGSQICPKTWAGSSKRANLWCSYCGSREHDAKFCPKTYSGNANRRAEPNGEFLD